MLRALAWSHPRRLQQHASTLGYSAYIWDNDKPSPYSNMSWDSLPPQQQQARASPPSIPCLALPPRPAVVGGRGGGFGR